MTRWQRFICFWLGWHKQGELVEYDGLTTHVLCAYCGGKFMVDSQGNLFQ
jgi:hypothetical protein